MRVLNKIIELIAKAFIIGYRRLVSPFFPPSCRFQPTCSGYAIEAIAVHGGVKGVWLAIKRVGRCRPGGGKGYDPVPDPKDKNKKHCHCADVS